MKLLIAMLVLYPLSTIAFALPADSAYKVTSSKVLKNLPNGFRMVLSCKMADQPSGDQTTMYALYDMKYKPVFWSLSGKDGRIFLNFMNLKDFRFLHVGSIGYIPVKIDLIPFKGKEVELELNIRPNMEPFVH